jgi:hypothetical protein
MIEMIKKIVLVLIINFIFFFSVGSVLYDHRTVNNRKVDLFVIGLEDEKILTDYLKPSTSHKCLAVKIITPSITKEIYYEISNKKLVRTDKCVKDIEITLDEHAVGSLTTAPYNSRNVIFSEFLMGHIRISGLKLKDFFTVLKWSDY